MSGWGRLVGKRSDYRHCTCTPLGDSSQSTTHVLLHPSYPAAGPRALPNRHRHSRERRLSLPVMKKRQAGSQCCPRWWERGCCCRWRPIHNGVCALSHAMGVCVRMLRRLRDWALYINPSTHTRQYMYAHRPARRAGCRWRRRRRGSGSCRQSPNPECDRPMFGVFIVSGWVASLL